MKQEVVTDYNKILCYGQENAIPAVELQAIMGFDNPRTLRADIHRAREAGQVILSSCKNGGGYYLPSCDAEVEEFISIYRAQALSILKVLRSARDYLNRDEGQLSFADIVSEWDGDVFDEGTI